jgi:cell division protein FtsN
MYPMQQRMSLTIVKDYAKPSRLKVEEEVPKKKMIHHPAVKKATQVLRRPWASLVIGLLLGLLMGGGLYFKLSHPATASPTVTANSAQSHNRKEARKSVQEAEVLTKPQFEFYDILPAREVPVESRPTSPAAKKQYVVQVASYQEKAQAQKVVQKLRQAQIDAHITLTPSGWWRVEVGPLDSHRDADTIRHNIQMQGMVGSLIREVSKQ